MLCSIKVPPVPDYRVTTSYCPGFEIKYGHLITLDDNRVPSACLFECIFMSDQKLHKFFLFIVHVYIPVH